jgi:hypothetical protein
MLAEVHNQNPLPPYEDYCQVKRRTKYTYDAIDMSALKNVDDPESYLGNAGVEYEQGWMKQDVAPDIKFGVAGTGIVFASWFSPRWSSTMMCIVWQPMLRNLIHEISPRFTPVQSSP